MVANKTPFTMINYVYTMSGVLASESLAFFSYYNESEVEETPQICAEITADVFFITSHGNACFCCFI